MKNIHVLSLLGAGLGLLALVACEDSSNEGGAPTDAGSTLPDGSQPGPDATPGTDAGGDADNPDVVVGPIACAASTTDIAANAAPPYRVVKLDGSRRLAVWSDNANGTATTSIYDGTQWLAPVPLAEKPQRIDVVADPAGNGYVAYSNDATTKVLRAVLKAGTTNFVADEVTGVGNLDVYNHIIAPLPSGAVMAFHVQGAPTAVNVAQYTSATSTWAAPQPLASIPSTLLPISIASNGNRAAIVTQDVTSGILSILTYDGTAWTTTFTTVPGATGPFSDPVVGVFANGDAYVAWVHPKDATTTNGTYGQRYHTATKTFDPVDALAADDARPHSAPQILVDSRDHLTVAWSEATGGSPGTMGIARDIGAGFVKTNLAGSAPVIAADPGGNVYAASSDTNGVSKVFRVAQNSTAWDVGATLPLVVPALDAQFYLNFTFDSTGKARVYGRGTDNHVVEVVCQ